MERKTQFIFEIDPEDTTNINQPLELTHNETEAEEKSLKVRLDKWLWAARFFKTRALARSAIENGRVYYEGQKTIPSKEIVISATILINQGKAKKIIVVRQLSTRRRSTDEANSLFEEISPQLYNATAMDTQLEQAPDMDKKPRKIARFLRRALAMGETEPPRE